MISRYDYLNIVLYLAFIVGVGVYFAKKSRNTSDYFRAGGSMPWWLTGAAAWMGSFSAWTFTGGAGKIYETGPYVVCLYFAMPIPLLVLMAFTCRRFRRMRVVTPLEAVRLRFGASSQQFYTWVRLPFLLLFGGISLNAVGVFMSAVFGMELVTVMIFLGLIVTAISLLGGSFAVVASDFVQMFLVVTVTVITAVLVLAHPGVGGVGGLIAKAPPIHFHWGEIARPGFIFVWFLALTVNNFFGQNTMENGTKYLMAANDREARLMPLIPIVGSLLGPLIWLIPPMGAAILHPDLGKMFPQLQYPHEAAFLASAVDVLPHGMLGLLVCGIFAATLTALDASLNQGAGIFVRNFYLPVVDPQCPEKKLLKVSKLCTGAFGTIIIAVAVVVSHFRSAGLFDFLNQLGVSLLLPLTIPLTVGFFYRRTPAWSTWSTVAIGLAVSYLVRFHTGPGMIGWLPGFRGPFKPEELTTYYIFATVSIVTAVCTGWFFFTSLFYRAAPQEYRDTVDEFFARLSTPIPQDPVAASSGNDPILGMIGKISLLYGGMIGIMAAIPNSPRGRLCYLFMGGLLAFAGWLICRCHAPKPGRGVP